MGGSISPEQEAILLRLEECFPDPYEPICNWVNAQPENEALRLVHYTTFETLEKILRNETLRFSPLARLNDIDELNKGKTLLRKFMLDANSRIREKILSLSTVDDTLCDEIWTWFEDSVPYEHLYSFISCWSMCTTNPRSYDDLAMWRGYASDGNGIAIVIDPLSFRFPLDRSEVGFWPVHYESEAGFEDRAFSAISDLVNGLLQVPNLVEQSAQWIVGSVFADLCFYLAITHKHPGFQAERECRFVWTCDSLREGALWSNMKPLSANGSYMNYFDLPIKYNPAISPMPLSIQSLITALMIGPCQHQRFVKSAIVGLLREVDHMGLLLQASPTPYRSNR